MARVKANGIEIEYELGLEAHSDGDVLVHALMDALLGAAALGDIGQHFPPSDPAYRGISSMDLLRRVMSLLGERNLRVGNVDVTVVAERPKLAPYVKRMRETIAAALSVPVEMVSVKATTNEGLGSIGRAEGISAHAVALLVGD